MPASEAGPLRNILVYKLGRRRASKELGIEGREVEVG